MGENRWTNFCQVTGWCSVVIYLMFGVVIATMDSNHGENGLQISPKELRRLRAKGLEMLPNGNSISTNTLSEEPNCEELRAMWRYYRRHARAAELTNRLPQFQLPELFWGMSTPGEPKSFGSLRGRNRPRFRSKSSKDSLYGRILYKQQKPPESGLGRRPMEQVVQIFGMPSSSSLANKSPINEKSDEPIVLLTPSLQPTPTSSLEKIKEIFRDERIKSTADIINPHSSLTTGNQGQEYGKVILSPPNGQDGRVANKPRELMTPYERIRFGHADDLFNGNDDSIRRRGSHLFPIKRQNGFLTLPILNSLPPHSSSSSWNSFPSEKYTNNQKIPFIQSKFEDSIIIPNIPNGQGLGIEINSLKPLLSSQIKSKQSEIGEISNEDLVSLMMEHELENNNPIDLLLQKESSFFVDTRVPFCPDIKNQPCSNNAECSCKGHGLYRCYARQCQTLSLAGTKSDERGEDGEFWHSEPLESSELGVWEDGSVPIGAVLLGEKKKRAVEIKKD